MKRLILLGIGIFIIVALSAQTSNIYTYPIYVGKVGTATGQLILRGQTSGTATITVPSVAGTGTVFQLPASNGTSGYLLSTNGSGVLSWIAPSESSTGVSITDVQDEIADSLNAIRANTIDGDLTYVLLQPDTVQHTASYTVAASDWPKDQHCLKATSIAITLPANLTDWPVGGVMNFYGEGAGIMVFKKASGVTFISDTDSIATSRKGQAVSVKKLAASKYFLVGPLTD
jgi:hypothetical protein